MLRGFWIQFLRWIPFEFGNLAPLFFMIILNEASRTNDEQAVAKPAFPNAVNSIWLLLEYRI